MVADASGTCTWACTSVALAGSDGWAQTVGAAGAVAVGSGTDDANGDEGRRAGDEG